MAPTAADVDTGQIYYYYNNGWQAMLPNPTYLAANELYR